jgi:lysozyme
VTPTNLIDQLKRDEGYKPYAYQDSEGWWTIGYGTLIDPRKGGSIPQDICELLLRRKAEEKNLWLAATLPWTSQLDEVRRTVLQNMSYNLGAKLLQFKNTLTLVQAGKYEEASVEMLKSLWAKQVGDRANRLAEQMKTGVWQ